MASALIGHTGFVGGNLARQHRFEDSYNSRNIDEIAGRHYELIVCAGAPAEKWKANKDPDADLAALGRLMRPLSSATASKVVLISTVDVYPVPIGVDERTVIDAARSTPYGRHRYQLETFMCERFDTLVLRLPALFGPGLKKNAVYDLLHDNLVSAIHADSVFQFYAVSRLWGDLERFMAARIPLVNVATEPVSMREVAAAAFGLEFDNRPSTPPARYDFRTVYAERFGGRDGYLLTKQQVLGDLAAFVQTERERVR